MLVGLVLGLAIYNSVLLDFPLPIALYKKLVGQQLSLRDLSEMEPTLGRSLRELLNYSGASPSAILCPHFGTNARSLNTSVCVCAGEGAIYNNISEHAFHLRDPYNQL